MSEEKDTPKVINVIVEKKNYLFEYNPCICSLNRSVVM